MLKKTVLSVLVVLLLSTTVDARGRIFRRSVYRYSSAGCFSQECVRDTCTKDTECEKTAEIAEKRAKYMATHGRGGHVLRHLGMGNGRMEGTGWTRGKVVKTTIATCHPGRVGRCIADKAYYSHKTKTTYRVRIFR